MKEENNKEVNIPISLLIENAKSEYMNSINEITEKYQLSPYLVWMIFMGFMTEIERNKNDQLFAESRDMELNKKEVKEDEK